jgi:hypothetical protein
MELFNFSINIWILVISVLRPKILLYGDNSPWPDKSLIETVLESDLTQSPDAVIIVVINKSILYI